MNIQKRLKKQLYNEVEGSCSGKYGFIIAVMSTEQVGYLRLNRLFRAGELKNPYLVLGRLMLEKLSLDGVMSCSQSSTRRSCTVLLRARYVASTRHPNQKQCPLSLSLLVRISLFDVCGRSWMLW